MTTVAVQNVIVNIVINKLQNYNFSEFSKDRAFIRTLNLISDRDISLKSQLLVWFHLLKHVRILSALSCEIFLSFRTRWNKSKNNLFLSCSDHSYIMYILLKRPLWSHMTMYSPASCTFINNQQNTPQTWDYLLFLNI